MTEKQFLDFIEADELTRRTLIEAHRDKRYKCISQLVYSNNGSGDCMFTPSGEELFLHDALDWVKTYAKRFYYLGNHSSRHTHLLCHKQIQSGDTIYLEYCSSHLFSFSEDCKGCRYATVEPYPSYPTDHIYHSKFLNVQKSLISD